eukprot:355524-Chlamydomonas_euryale.AAC.7
MVSVSTCVSPCEAPTAALSATTHAHGRSKRYHRGHPRSAPRCGRHRSAPRRGHDRSARQHQSVRRHGRFRSVRRHGCHRSAHCCGQNQSAHHHGRHHSHPGRCFPAARRPVQSSARPGCRGRQSSVHPGCCALLSLPPRPGKNDQVPNCPGPGHQSGCLQNPEDSRHRRPCPGPPRLQGHPS